MDFDDSSIYVWGFECCDCIYFHSLVVTLITERSNKLFLLCILFQYYEMIFVYTSRGVRRLSPIEKCASAVCVCVCVCVVDNTSHHAKQQPQRKEETISKGGVLCILG